MYHTKFTRVQSVMKIEIRSPNEKMKSSLRHLQPGLMDHFEPFFKNQKSQFKITEQIKRMEGFSDKINLSSDSTNEDESSLPSNDSGFVGLNAENWKKMNEMKALYPYI